MLVCAFMLPMHATTSLREQLKSFAHGVIKSTVAVGVSNVVCPQDFKIIGAQVAVLTMIGVDYYCLGAKEDCNTLLQLVGHAVPLVLFFHHFECQQLREQIAQMEGADKAVTQAVQRIADADQKIDLAFEQRAQLLKQARVAVTTIHESLDKVSRRRASV